MSVKNFIWCYSSLCKDPRAHCASETNQNYSNNNKERDNTVKRSVSLSFTQKRDVSTRIFSAGACLFKVNDGNIRTICEICSQN